MDSLPQAPYIDIEECTPAEPTEARSRPAQARDEQHQLEDEFAKWAKLRRKHDKAMDEYEAMSSYPALCTEILCFLLHIVEVQIQLIDRF